MLGEYYRRVKSKDKNETKPNKQTIHSSIKNKTNIINKPINNKSCLLYTSDAADD